MALLENTLRSRPFAMAPGMESVIPEASLSGASVFHVPYFIAVATLSAAPGIFRFVRTAEGVVSYGDPSGSTDLSFLNLLESSREYKPSSIDRSDGGFPTARLQLGGKLSGQADPEIYGDAARRHLGSGARHPDPQRDG